MLSPLGPRLIDTTLPLRSKSGNGASPSTTDDGEGDALRLREGGTGGGGPLPDGDGAGLVASAGTRGVPSCGGVVGRLPSSLLAVDVDG